jgi:hypothetical protein
MNSENELAWGSASSQPSAVMSRSTTGGGDDRKSNATFSLPMILLATYLVVAIVVGILAAVGPARRASRVDVLTAVTVE